MNRKVLIILTAMILALCSVLIVNAEDINFSLSGNESVATGDVLKVTVKINGSDINGCQGTIVYNPEQLSIKSITPLKAEPWVYSLVEGDNTDGDFEFLYSDNPNSLDDPINGEANLLSVEFTVLDIPVGTSISVTIKNTVVTVNYGDQISNIDDVIFTTKVTKKASDNNLLKDLNVANAKISPAFKKDTISYTASVPFSIKKLEFTALTEDPKATMQVNNPELTANSKTNVTITVTSEAGTKKVYTIQVTRAQDPNSNKSSNSKLSSINTGFELTPEFSSDVTEYSMEVPYDITALAISASMQDSKSTYTIEGADEILVGNNTVKIACTAEDGSKKEYTIIVRRASEESNATLSPTLEPTPSSTDDLDKTPKETNNSQVIISDPPKGMPYWLVIILIIVFTGIGFIFGMSVNIKKNGYDDDEREEIVESNFENEVSKKKDKDMLFIVEDNLRDDDSIYDRFKK